jgi:hypothetical protein
MYYFWAQFAIHDNDTQPTTHKSLSNSTYISMFQNTFIPDISYHLIFSFLSIHELASISQCSKEWRRIVTEPCFFNMYRQTDMLTIDNKNNVSKSPLRHVIRKVRIETLDNEINHLGFYNRLEVLEMTFDWIYFHSIDHNFDFVPVFKILGPKLCELNVHLRRWNAQNIIPNSYSFVQFHKALSLLTSITLLRLQNVYSQLFISDISFLSVMKQLQSFSCNCINVTAKELAATLQSSCPDLTRLEVGYFRNSNDLEEICQGLQHSQLSHLGAFSNISRIDQNLYAQSLNKLRNLKTIEYSLQYIIDIPHTSLGRWIHHLEIFDKNLYADHVNSIIALPHLKSLKMIGLGIETLQIQNLIESLSSRLEHLFLDRDRDWDEFEISFQSLSKCIKLKTLSILNITFSDSRCINILFNCQQLETICINCFNFIYLPKKEKVIMDQAFKIPSSVFPNLKSVHID